MCPDQQLLSIYVDGELPSPWKEKMESHLKVCPVCREKLESFKQLHELFKKDNTEKRTYVERIVDEPEEERTYTEEEMQEAKERIWKNIESKRNFKPRSRLWRRRVSIPLPAAAAAAVILALVAMLWLRSGQVSTNAIAGRQPDDKINFILAAEDEIPGIMPVSSDLSGVLQYLGADGSDIIILKLPESRNFSRAGEPSIIRAADYQRGSGGR
ncbi:MAG: zf-HC2 domain-containing protein [Treponema sp.]|nr:zf-HC2 domain-containing protein [Treponema sp.]